MDTMDEVLKSGQKIQYAHSRRLKISEPRRLWIESTGDVTNTSRRFTAMGLICEMAYELMGETR